MAIFKNQTSEVQIVKFAYQITTALKYLHENNIFHRDIRARNIYVYRTHGDWIARLSMCGAGSIIKYIKEY